MNADHEYLINDLAHAVATANMHPSAVAERQADNYIRRVELTVERMSKPVFVKRVDARSAVFTNGYGEWMSALTHENGEFEDVIGTHPTAEDAYSCCEFWSPLSA